MRKQGFTLLELSIVLLVIVLIISGITAARALKENADLQSILASVDNYRNSAVQFRDKYKELPGDFTGATALWGARGTCDPTVAETGNDTYALATCNGTGDGKIGRTSVANLSADDPGYKESLLFWQHLVNAGFIKGSYTGLPSALPNGIKLKSNMPGSPFKDGAFVIRAITPSGTTVLGGTGYNNTIMVGKYDLAQNSTQLPTGVLFTGDQAKSLDAKIDDSNPNAGKVRAPTSSGACTSSTNRIGATYAASSQPTCTLLFITGF